MNSYECYFAVKKLLKPIINYDNCGAESVRPEAEISKDLRSSDQWTSTMTRETSIVKIPDEESKSPLEFGKMRTLSNSTVIDGSNNELRTSKQKILAKLNNTPLKKSLFFKNYVSKILKKKESVETQTSSKSRYRYLVIDQGRLLVIKSLVDKTDEDGSKIEKSKIYPEFQNSQKSEMFQLPNTVYNAKIVRVYKLQFLKSLGIKNFRDLASIFNQKKMILA